MPILLGLVLVVGAIGFVLVQILSNWMDTGAAVLVTVVFFMAFIAYLISVIRRRIRVLMANPSVAGIVRTGGVAALGLMALRNPKLLFTLGSTYWAMRRNRPR